MLKQKLQQSDPGLPLSDSEVLPTTWSRSGDRRLVHGLSESHAFGLPDALSRPLPPTSRARDRFHSGSEATARSAFDIRYDAGGYGGRSGSGGREGAYQSWSGDRGGREGDFRGGEYPPPGSRSRRTMMRSSDCNLAMSDMHGGGGGGGMSSRFRDPQQFGRTAHNYDRHRGGDIGLRHHLAGRRGRADT